MVTELVEKELFEYQDSHQTFDLLLCDRNNSRFLYT